MDLLDMCRHCLITGTHYPVLVEGYSPAQFWCNNVLYCTVLILIAMHALFGVEPPPQGRSTDHRWRCYRLQPLPWSRPGPPCFLVAHKFQPSRATLFLKVAISAMEGPSFLFQITPRYFHIFTPTVRIIATRCRIPSQSRRLGTKGCSVKRLAPRLRRALLRSSAPSSPIH